VDANLAMDGATLGLEAGLAFSDSVIYAVLAACTPKNQKGGSRIFVFPVDRFGGEGD
jgi:hypothetical protein